MLELDEARGNALDGMTLRDLAAKSARLGIWAARQGCHAVNLSTDDTRLTLPRANAVAEIDLDTGDEIRRIRVGIVRLRRVADADGGG